MAAERQDRPDEPGTTGPARESAKAARSTGSDQSLIDGMRRRVRRLLSEVEGILHDPASTREMERLSGPATLEADKALAEMKLGLEAALNGATRLGRAFSDEDALPPLLAHLDRPLPRGLPESVERFLRERSRAPGFEYELRDDETRGWLLSWKQRDSDGQLLGAGHLYERPFSPPGR